MNNLSEIQVNAICEVVRIELLKRGFTAPLTTNEFVTKHETRHFEITSEPFQTVPVIMKEIRIEGRISTSNQLDENGTMRVGVRVGVAYKHFTGGSNGTELFNLTCETRNDTDVYNVRIF